MANFKGGFSLDHDKQTASEKYCMPYLPSDAAGLELHTKILEVTEHVVERGKHKGNYYYKIIYQILFDDKSYIRPLTYFNTYQIGPLLKFFQIKVFDKSELLEGKEFIAVFGTDENTGYINSIVSFDAVGGSGSSDTTVEKTVDIDEVPF